MMTVQDVADYLQVSEKLVIGLIHKGKLRASKIARYYRIRREDLDAFLDEGAKELSEPRLIPIG
ncbi:MAG: helix-turn-helix domain-containing protein [Kiritimatiellae bacterium]|nr:helix-turn-helix domain-containing protein [Kiritimatiellia bacterium]